MSDNWDFYFCRIDDHPASVFVDLGVGDRAPLADQSRLVWMRVHMQTEGSDGLSSDAEYNALAHVEDAIEATANGHRFALTYVGRNTATGFRDFYFYTDDGQAAEALITEVMAGFPEYQFDTGGRDDPSWDFYFDFLYPNEEQMQVIHNGRVLRSLTENGDHHDIPRPILHFAYFATDEDRHRFQMSLASLGYATEASTNDPAEALPFRLRFSRIESLDFDSVNDATLVLCAMAKDCNGEYDGWESPVMHPEPDVSTT